MYALFQDRLQRLNRFGTGDMPFSVRRSSYRSIMLDTTTNNAVVRQEKKPKVSKESRYEA